MRERPEAGDEPRAETLAWPDVEAQVKPPGEAWAERSGATRTELSGGTPVEPAAEVEVRKRRMDLSVPQVAGSAVAAVVAAKLASYFGVYGTILGAGVVSVLATCGGTFFQHFLSRTGEQIREVKVVAAKPRDQLQEQPGGRRPERHPASPRATRRGHLAPVAGEFTEATVYRARVKSWKRPLVAAALVFGVTMAGITTYELASGDSFTGNGGTTVGDAFSGKSSSSSTDDDTPSPSTSPTESAQEGGTSQDSPTPEPGVSDGTGATESGQGTDDGGTASSGATPTPGATEGDSTDGSGTTPAPSATATTPAPSASSRSENAGQGQDGPAAR
jgi:hypothetical protein